MPPGGYNDIPNELLINQQINISRILLDSGLVKKNKMKFNYGIISGKVQIVAGFNYRMYIKYCTKYYLVHYFIPLKGNISGNIFITKVLNDPIICDINEELFKLNYSDSDSDSDSDCYNKIYC